MSELKVRTPFASMSPSERLRIATQGASISSFANSKPKPLSKQRTKEIGRILERSLKDWNPSDVAQIADTSV